MTNFERIKNRTIEQVAKDIYKTDDNLLDEICNQNEPCPFWDNVTSKQCIDCVKKWLAQEYKK